MRILVVEDEDSIRTALVRAFTRDGHEVRAAADLGEAQAFVSGWTPDLAVSDLKLPDGNGLDLMDRLRVPFIMLSGYATYDDAVRALRCGAVDFFTKPVAIKDIRAAIGGARRPTGPPTQVIWSEAAAAPIAARQLFSHLSGPLARLAVAELACSAATGRLSVHADERGTRVWLDGANNWAQFTERSAWLTAHGVRLTASPEAVVAVVDKEPETTYDESTERLWSQELVAGRAVQAGSWVTAGSWLLASVQAGAGPFIGLSGRLVTACATCGVSIRTAPESLTQPGVGGEERAGLFDDDGIGSPVA